MKAHRNCSNVMPLYVKNPAIAMGAAIKMQSQLAVSLDNTLPKPR